jgi:hypothetical protein
MAIDVEQIAHLEEEAPGDPGNGPWPASQKLGRRLCRWQHQELAWLNRNRMISEDADLTRTAHLVS